jgi:hypothetical protein
MESRNPASDFGKPPTKNSPLRIGKCLYGLKLHTYPIKRGKGEEHC